MLSSNELFLEMLKAGIAANAYGDRRVGIEIIAKAHDLIPTLMMHKSTDEIKSRAYEFFDWVVKTLTHDTPLPPPEWVSWKVK